MYLVAVGLLAASPWVSLHDRVVGIHSMVMSTARSYASFLSSLRRFRYLSSKLYAYIPKEGPKGACLWLKHRFGGKIKSCKSRDVSSRAQMPELRDDRRVKIPLSAFSARVLVEIEALPSEGRRLAERLLVSGRLFRNIRVRGHRVTWETFRFFRHVQMPGVKIRNYGAEIRAILARMPAPETKRDAALSGEVLWMATRVEKTQRDYERAIGLQPELLLWAARFALVHTLVRQMTSL